jgi:sodium/potassium-transporting ATPase subunit alpha
VEAASAQAEESRNIAFSSSGCIEGEAVGLVIRAGDGTMIGKIAKLATATGGVSMSTLERDIHHFVTVRVQLSTAGMHVLWAWGLGLLTVVSAACVSVTCHLLILRVIACLA